MELVYLWVEEYKNIKKQGFNFSPRFKCEYDEDTNELTIDENKDYVSIFPENINITAIVGENGAGKTSIQSLLNIICSRIKVKLKTKYILLTLINNHIHYQSNFDFTKENTLIQNIHNISVLTYFNSIEEECNKDKKRHLNYTNKINYIRFSNLEINQFMSMHIQEDQPFPKNKIFYFPSNIIIKPIDFSELFDQIIYNENEKVSNSLELLELFEEINDYYHKFLILVHLENSLFEIDKLNDINYLEKEFKKYKGYITQEEFNTFFNEKTLDLDLLKKKEKDFYLYNFNYFFEIDYIDSKERNWSSLSTGEQMLFGIFLNLYFFYRAAENLQNNLLITFDEIELCLHPNWQKRFLIEIIDFTKKLNTKFNLIISSHSPFILSDLPKENVVFLEKGKQIYPFEDNQQTFGANIHTLLSHGFFMKDGLMGEFAKSKISKILKFLNGENKFIDLEVKILPPLKIQNNFFEKNLKPIIEFIGEDFLKEKLLKMYEIKFPKSNEAKIKELENEIKRLKNASN
ncbi:AAA family ATPase [Malaciobacter marinus]|uniref:AAA family ATPase n=1 Tax=Malaciobacter marinus TaxID=505249 RepID=UPI0013FE3DF1|nr:AAA family ATPase [Malaciobacter marinus]